MFIGIIAIIFAFVFNLVGTSFYLTGKKHITEDNPYAWIDSGSALLVAIALIVVLVLSIFGIISSYKQMRSDTEKKQGRIGLVISIISALGCLAGAIAFLIVSISLQSN